MAVELNLWEMSGAFEEVSGIPHLSWETVAKWIDANCHGPERQAEGWYEAQVQWVGKLREVLGAPHEFYEASRILFLSALPGKKAERFLVFAEKALDRIGETLKPLTEVNRPERIVLVDIATTELFHRYLTRYFPKPEELPQVAHYLPQGLGHLAVGPGDAGDRESALTHRMALLSLSHLPLPAWAAEGLALRAQAALASSGGVGRFLGLGGTGAAAGGAGEAVADLAEFWKETGLEIFWKGLAFRPDNPDLAAARALADFLVTTLLKHDRDQAAEFFSQAHASDAGEAAAQAVLGVSMAELVEPVLGEGDWGPGNPGPNATELRD